RARLLLCDRRWVSAGDGTLLGEQHRPAFSIRPDDDVPELQRERVGDNLQEDGGERRLHRRSSRAALARCVPHSACRRATSGLGERPSPPGAPQCNGRCAKRASGPCPRPRLGGSRTAVCRGRACGAGEAVPRYSALTRRKPRFTRPDRRGSGREAFVDPTIQDVEVTVNSWWGASFCTAFLCVAESPAECGYGG